MQRYFITGIGTDVGKTVISAIVTESLKADYWKPIQAGDLDYSDTDKVKALVSNQQSYFHKNAFALKTPMSPHAAAAIDGIEVKSKAINTPQNPTNNPFLVVEGAGGLLVPINNTETILDLIQPDDKVILVSRHYLGSINHTLLSAEVLKSRYKDISIGIIFNGEEHPTTESIIEKKTELPVLGRIDEDLDLTKETISRYAQKLKTALENL